MGSEFMVFLEDTMLFVAYVSEYSSPFFQFLDSKNFVGQKYPAPGQSSTELGLWKQSQLCAYGFPHDQLSFNIFAYLKCRPFTKIEVSFLENCGDHQISISIMMRFYCSYKIKSQKNDLAPDEMSSNATVNIPLFYIIAQEDCRCGQNHRFDYALSIYCRMIRSLPIFSASSSFYITFIRMK